MLKVAQCWDDAVVTDIRLTEMFRKYHAKATFNLNPGLMRPERIPSRWAPFGAPGWSHKGFYGGKVGINEMLDVYGDFQVASHCWCHEAAGRVDNSTFIKAALDARHFLEDKFQRPCPGFAWPVGAFTADTCKLMREAGFAYGRTTQNSTDVTKYDDPMALHPSCHFQDINFKDKYLAAKETGVFYFWGHSYEMFDCEGLWQQLEAKIKFISEDPDAEWVDVIDIVK